VASSSNARTNDIASAQTIGSTMHPGCFADANNSAFKRGKWVPAEIRGRWGLNVSVSSIEFHGVY
jgi:hypothetical protein